MGLSILTFLATFLAFPVNPANSQAVCSRSVTEYLLPEAEQTHEIFYIHAKDILLITQFSNSHFLKAHTAPGNAFGGITSVKSQLVGNSTSGLHGLWPSTWYPDKFWVTLERDNQLILLDPVLSDINAAVEILKVIPVPLPGDGPHHIAEYEKNVWATLKASLHILRINHENIKDYTLYPAHPIPIFLAMHPISKEIYASEYKSDTILRINSIDNTLSRIEVPSRVGESPVGLVSHGAYTWVTLLSIKSRGTGAFGKIYANGTIRWYKLKTKLGRQTPILHIAFDPNGKTEPRNGMWLLGSSVENSDAFDVIIRAHFDKDFEHFEGEEIALLPSQSVKAHRVVASRPGIYVTELASSRVAFYKRAKFGVCNFAFQPYELENLEEI